MVSIFYLGVLLVASVSQMRWNILLRDRREFLYDENDVAEDIHVG